LSWEFLKTSIKEFNAGCPIHRGLEMGGMNAVRPALTRRPFLTHSTPTNKGHFLPFCLSFRSPASKPGRETRPTLPKAGANPAGKATDLIAFAVAVVFILRFQPKNHVSSPKTH
jgi:hypothetical protein